MPNSFYCDKCGICCKNIHQIPQLAAFDLGNGVCKYLKDNLCSIYDHRPEICNVDAMYDRYYKDFFSKDEFYQLNYLGCEILKKSKKRLLNNK